MISFERWAVVSYNDDTGLGRMAQDIKSVLGVCQIVVPSQRLATKPLVPGRDRFLKADADEAALSETVAHLDGLILLERADWHPKLVEVARRRGLAIVCVPMWEWFRGTDACWAAVDTFVCPSQKTFDVVQSYGWRNSVRLPWALDLSRFPGRIVSGPGRVFIHNAGLVDYDDRKGTRETIAAFRGVRRNDIRLVIRLQRPADLPSIDGRIELRIGNVDEPSALYADGDIALQPSKMEGLGFMVIEPFVSGLPVITTDHPPMNEVVTNHRLLVRTKWFARDSFPRRAAGVRHARLRIPHVRDIRRKIEWCAETDMTDISRGNREYAEGEFEPIRLRCLWGELLDSLTRRRLPRSATIASPSPLE